RRILWTEIRMRHDPVASTVARAPVGPERCAERGSCVSRRRLYPHLPIQTRIADARIHYAIERHAACHAEVLGAGARLEPARQLDRRFLEHELQRARDIEVALFQRPTA